jgi:hypothetical protein
MKTITAVLQTFFLLSFLVASGCESASPAAQMPPKPNSDFDGAVYAGYAPVKIDIMPLTEFIFPDGDEEASKIKVYVTLLDSFDCQIKSPGVFRFELYERIPRRSEPKGKRIIIWPDVDLVDPVENNEHWRDFLRAYEFDLNFVPVRDQSYILQVTSLCPSGKRLSAEFGLKHTE